MKRILVILYIVVVAVMAAATIVENYQGTEFVAQHIYGAWWFSVLWALLAAAGVFWFVKKRVRRPSVVVLHLSFVVILVGALLTHLTAVRGVIPLRKEIPTNQYLTRDMHVHQLPFTICLKDFQIECYEGSDDPKDYISHVSIGDEAVTISMNHIASRSGIRLYQMDFDPDLQGSILAMNSDPWGIPVTYCGYALLFVSLLWMLIDSKGGFREHLSLLPRRHLSLVISVLLLLFAFLLYHFLGKYSEANHPLPVLNSWLLPVHVSVIIMAYTLLLVIFIISLVALVGQWSKGKGHSSLLTYHLSLLLLYPALAFLGYGIFIGAIWANVSWGNYWSWDPKETWALITFMIYAVPAHKSFRSSTCHLSPSTYHLYMALAFLTILMTYFGVNYLLGGMHSYA